MHIEDEEAFSQVEFIQADLTKPAHLERVFANEVFDYVVNLAAETRCNISFSYYMYIYF
jgi:dTDP-D-glucose 4,6-dehydratase